MTALCVGNIFHDFEIMFFRYCHDPVHIAGVCFVMNDHNGFGTGGYAAFKTVRIHLQSKGIHITEYHTSAKMDHAKTACPVGEGRGNDFISGTDSGKFIGNFHTAGPIIEEAGIF